jgi:hypothetical protein
MSIDATQPVGCVNAAASVPGGSATRTLVLFERGRCGAVALRRAAELTAASDVELTVVTLAPQAAPNRCCGPGVQPFNCAVREEAELELREARDMLGPGADRTTFKVLVEDRDPPLAVWVAERAFDLVLLPAHRLRPGGHRAARKLRRSTAADVRVVG